jgi:PKD repeat protein
MKALLVFLALALLTTSSAAAQSITVDGNGSDWVGLTGVKCMDDDTEEIGTLQTPYFVNGYDIADFCVYYDQFNDTLNFKINVTGVPGDTDGDGNPNSSDNNITDKPEVGYGETYAVRLYIDGDGGMEYKLKYFNNGLVMENCTNGDVVNGTASGSIGSSPYSNTVVEMSFSPAHNMSGFGVDNNFSAQGWAGNEYDKLGEDDTSVSSVNLAPVPLLVGEDVCFCTDTNFNGSASYDPDGEIVSWDWDFGDGNVSSGNMTSHHYAETGTYTVTLIVTDDYGFTSSNTTTVEVYENPSTNFTSTKVCFCTNTTFNDTTVGGTAPYTYTWDFDGDGTVDSTEQNASYHYSSPGTHTATLNVTDANGCSNEKTVAVYVVHTPVAIADVNRSWVATPGGWVLFSATNSTYDANVTNSLSYNWTIHGATYTGENVTYNVTNTTTAFLTVTDEYGCTNSSSVNVTYRHRPVPVIDFTAIGCLKVKLNASNSSDHDGCITNYSWDLNNNGTYGDAFGITCNATFGAGGYYTVGLNVTDNHNLTNATTREIYVFGKPTAVAKVNRSDVATPGGAVLFNGSDSTCDTNGTEPNSLVNYTWEIHGKLYYGVTVPYYVTSNTTASLKVTDEYGCMNSSSVNVTYRHRPVPVINFTATDCLEVELNASNSSDHDGHITNYSWDLNNNGTYGDAFGIACTYNFGVGGNHTVGLNVTDNDGLTNTTTKVIYVSYEPTAVADANRSWVATPCGWVLFSATSAQPIRRMMRMSQTH